MRPTTLDESEGPSEAVRDSVRKVGAWRTVLRPDMSLNTPVPSLAEPEDASVASVAIDTSRDSAVGNGGGGVRTVEVVCGGGGRTRRLYGVRRVLLNESSSVSYIESSGSSMFMWSSSSSEAPRSCVLPRTPLAPLLSLEPPAGPGFNSFAETGATAENPAKMRVHVLPWERTGHRLN